MFHPLLELDCEFGNVCTKWRNCKNTGCVGREKIPAMFFSSLWPFFFFFSIKKQFCSLYSCPASLVFSLPSRKAPRPQMTSSCRTVCNGRMGIISQEQEEQNTLQPEERRWKSDPPVYAVSPESIKAWGSFSEPLLCSHLAKLGLI